MSVRKQKLDYQFRFPNQFKLAVNRLIFQGSWQRRFDHKESATVASTSGTKNLNLNYKTTAQPLLSINTLKSFDFFKNELFRSVDIKVHNLLR